MMVFVQHILEKIQKIAQLIVDRPTVIEMECVRKAKMPVPAHMIAVVIMMAYVKQNVEKIQLIAPMIVSLHSVIMMVFANLKMGRIHLIAPAIVLPHPNAIIMAFAMQENIGLLAAIVLPAQSQRQNITM
jgi:hypothetical protein